MDTQFGDLAAILGCDWVTESPGEGDEVFGAGTVPEAWLTEARRVGAVALVSADLGVELQPGDDAALRTALDAAAAAGRLLAGLARLDEQPR